MLNPIKIQTYRDCVSVARVKLQCEHHAAVDGGAQAVKHNTLFSAVQQLSRAFEQSRVRAVPPYIDIVARGLQPGRRAL